MLWRDFDLIDVMLVYIETLHIIVFVYSLLQFLFCFVSNIMTLIGVIPV